MADQTEQNEERVFPVADEHGIFDIAAGEIIEALGELKARIQLVEQPGGWWFRITAELPDMEEPWSARSIDLIPSRALAITAALSDLDAFCALEKEQGSRKHKKAAEKLQGWGRGFAEGAAAEIAQENAALPPDTLTPAEAEALGAPVLQAPATIVSGTIPGYEGIITGELRTIPLSELHESPWNPRQYYPEAAMQELVESMKASGFRPWQPLLVRPRPESEWRKLNEPAGYEIGAGHRRRRAAELAGITEVPCVVRPMSDQEFSDVLNFDNGAHENVHPLHEAAGWRAHMERTGQGVLAIAARIGKSKEYVYQHLKYSALIPEAQQAFLDNKFSDSHAILIARQTPDQQEMALEFLENDPLPSSRDLDGWLRRAFYENLALAPFETADALLLPEAGNCIVCPKRLANDPSHIAVEGEADLCTDPKCCDRKTKAHFVQIDAQEEQRPEPQPETPSEMAQAVVSRARKTEPTVNEAEEIERRKEQERQAKAWRERIAKERRELVIRDRILGVIIAKMRIDRLDIPALWRAQHETDVIDPLGTPGILELSKRYKVDAAKIRADMEKAAKQAEGGTPREVKKPAKPKPAAPKASGRIPAATIKKIASAVKKRWAEHKRQEAAKAKPAAKKPAPKAAKK